MTSSQGILYLQAHDDMFHSGIILDEWGYEPIALLPTLRYIDPFPFLKSFLTIIPDPAARLRSDPFHIYMYVSRGTKSKVGQPHFRIAFSSLLVLSVGQIISSQDVQSLWSAPFTDLAGSEASRSSEVFRRLMSVYR